MEGLLIEQNRAFTNFATSKGSTKKAVLRSAVQDTELDEMDSDSQIQIQSAVTGI